MNTQRQRSLAMLSPKKRKALIQLERLTVRLGRIPSEDDLDHAFLHGAAPTRAFMRKHFRNINEALLHLFSKKQLAKFPKPTPRTPPLRIRFDDETILSNFRALTLRLGHRPDTRDIEKSCAAGELPRSLYQRFGGIGRLLSLVFTKEELNKLPRSPVTSLSVKRWTREDAINAVKAAVAAAGGNRPSAKHFAAVQKKGHPSLEAIVNNLGKYLPMSIKTALEKAGFGHLTSKPSKSPFESVPVSTGNAALLRGMVKLGVYVDIRDATDHAVMDLVAKLKRQGIAVAPTLRVKKKRKKREEVIRPFREKSFRSMFGDQI
jgi:hypothetical protein